MGACCTCQRGSKFQGFLAEDDEDEQDEKDMEDESIMGYGDFGARVRVHGSSRFVSTYTQQGRKGTNQDSMTVWENFVGEKDSFFCGVFDGHGPSGHKVSRFVRDILPSKISSSFKQSESNARHCNADAVGSGKEDGHDDIINRVNLFYISWKASLIKSYKDMDEELEANTTIDSYFSGSTSVAVLKQGDRLIIANLGDSRAVLCTRDNRDELVPVQLTIDLKPNLPGEAERISSCKGRVLAMEEEPTVYRIWMPDDDCPGLAMARAFGDFCLKDYGLISIPDVFYRHLTDRDEFVVLATDGVWDVLTNEEVIAVVASVRKRSMAAKTLVDRAVRAWRYRYPNSKVDDCAVICLFFKIQQPQLTKSVSETTHLNSNYSYSLSEFGLHHRHHNSDRSLQTDDGLDTVLNYGINTKSTAGNLSSTSHYSEVDARDCTNPGHS